ncbi:MAG TPA: PEGA domain-containing protein, partial [Myxococcota bacterium]
FDAATDADVVQQVRHKEVAPLRDPRIDSALGELVARLLDKDPTQRPTAAQALAVLDDVVASRCLDDGLARHVARAVRQAPRRDLTAINPDVPRRQTQRVLGGLAGADTVVRKPVLARRWPLFAGAAVVVAVVVVVGTSSSSSSSSSSDAVVVVDLPAEPSAVAVSEPPPMSIEPDAPALHVPPPAVEAPKQATPKPATPKPPATTKPAAAPVVDGIGRLSVTSEPWARVSVDGVVVAKETPLRAHSLPAGPHTITLENPVLHLKKSIVVDVEKDGHARRFVDLAAP